MTCKSSNRPIFAETAGDDAKNSTKSEIPVSPRKRELPALPLHIHVDQNLAPSLSSEREQEFYIHKNDSSNVTNGRNVCFNKEDVEVIKLEANNEHLYDFLNFNDKHSDSSYIRAENNNAQDYPVNNNKSTPDFTTVENNMKITNITENNTYDLLNFNVAANTRSETDDTTVESNNKASLNDHHIFPNAHNDLAAAMIFKEFIEPNPTSTLLIQLPHPAVSSSSSSNGSRSSTVLDCREIFDNQADPRSLVDLDNDIEKNANTFSKSVDKNKQADQQIKTSELQALNFEMAESLCKTTSATATHADLGAVAAEQVNSEMKNSCAANGNIPEHECYNATAKQGKTASGGRKGLFRGVYKLKRYLRLKSRHQKQKKNALEEDIALEEKVKHLSDEENQEKDVNYNDPAYEHSQNLAKINKTRIGNMDISNNTEAAVDKLVGNTDNFQEKDKIVTNKVTQPGMMLRDSKKDDAIDGGSAPSPRVGGMNCIGRIHAAACRAKRTESIVSTVVAPGVRVHVLSAKGSGKSGKISDKKLQHCKDIIYLEKDSDDRTEKVVKEFEQFAFEDVEHDKPTAKGTNRQNEQRPFSMNNTCKDKAAVDVNEKCSNENTGKEPVCRTVSLNNRYKIDGDHCRSSSINHVEEWLAQTSARGSDLLARSAKSLEPVVDCTQVQNLTKKNKGARPQCEKQLSENLASNKMIVDNFFGNDSSDSELPCKAFVRERRRLKSNACKIVKTNSGSHIIAGRMRLSGRSSMDRRRSAVGRYRGRRIYVRPRINSQSRGRTGGPYFSCRECKALCEHNLLGLEIPPRPNSTSTPQKDLQPIRQQRYFDAINQDSPLVSTPAGYERSKLDASLLQYVTELIESLEKGRTASGDSMLSTPHAPTVSAIHNLHRHINLHSHYQTTPTSSSVPLASKLSSESNERSRFIDVRVPDKHSTVDHKAEGSSVSERITDSGTCETRTVGSSGQQDPGEPDVVVAAHRLSAALNDVDAVLTFLKDKFRTPQTSDTIRSEKLLAYGKYVADPTIDNEYKRDIKDSQHLLWNFTGARIPDASSTRKSENQTSENDLCLASKTTVRQSILNGCDNLQRVANSAELLRRRLLETSLQGSTYTTKYYNLHSAEIAKLSMETKSATNNRKNDEQTCFKKKPGEIENLKEKIRTCRCDLNVSTGETEENKEVSVGMPMAAIRSIKGTTDNTSQAENTYHSVTVYPGGLQLECRCGSIKFTISSHSDPKPILKYIEKLMVTEGDKYNEMCCSILRHIVLLQWEELEKLQKNTGS